MMKGVSGDGGGGGGGERVVVVRVKRYEQNLKSKAFIYSFQW